MKQCFVGSVLMDVSINHESFCQEIENLSLTFDPHIKDVKESAFFNLLNIAKMHPIL